jgi:hypothetical protein
MKNQSYLPALFLIFCVFTNCAKKSLTTCGLGLLMNRPNIESKIISFETIGNSNTMYAYIKGVISCKDSLTSESVISTNDQIFINYNHQILKETMNVVVDSLGRFEIKLRTGTYDIFVHSYGYNSIEIKNVFIGIGEIKKLNILLGQKGRDSTSSLK